MFYANTKTTLIIEGTISILLGIFAMILPTFTAVSVTFVIGILCMLAGVTQFFRAFHDKKRISFSFAALNAVIVFIIGILLLARPVTGMMAFTLLLGIWFLISGSTQIITAFQVRHRHAYWVVLLLSGIFSVALALIIWYSWPITSLVTTYRLVGILLGLNLLFFGVALIALAVHMIELEPDVKPVEKQ